MPDDQLDFETIDRIFHHIDNRDAQERERRKQRDWLTVMPIVLSMVAFCMVVAVWIILQLANPVPHGSDWGWLSFFGEIPQGQARWPRRPVNVAYYMLIVSMIMCVIAFICNRFRLRRKNDKLRVSVFLIGCIALVTFVSFLVQFLPLGILGTW